MCALQWPDRLAVCVSETLFPSVKFCNVIHPWHRQRSKGYGAEGSSAERTESCCFHSHNYWKTTAIWSEHEYLNTSPVSLAWLLVHSYLILRYKATRLMESCSLSHIKSGSGPLKSTKCDTQCLIKKKKKALERRFRLQKAEGADVRWHLIRYEVIRCCRDWAVLKAERMTLWVKVQISWYTGILEVIGSVSPYQHKEVGAGYREWPCRASMRTDSENVSLFTYGQIYCLNFSLSSFLNSFQHILVHCMLNTLLSSCMLKSHNIMTMNTILIWKSAFSLWSTSYEQMVSLNGFQWGGVGGG